MPVHLRPRQELSDGLSPADLLFPLSAASLVQVQAFRAPRQDLELEGTLPVGRHRPLEVFLVDSAVRVGGGQRGGRVVLSEAAVA